MAAEQQNQCFVHRVQEIPMVSATVGQALSVYEKTKNYNRLFGATLALAENSVKYAVEKAQPVRRILDGPIVATNKLACQQLEKLEERYPVILITPEMLVQRSKEYYEQSRVKSGVDAAYSIKNYGVEKVQNTKQLATNVVNGIVYGSQMKLVDVLRYGLLVVNNALNYSDGFIDTYIAAPSSEQNGPVGPLEEESSAISRLHRMSTKVGYGLRYKANKGFVASKEYVLHVLAQLQSTLVLLEYAKNNAGWSNDEMMGKLLAVQGQLNSLWQQVQRRTSKYGSPEMALLMLAKKVSSNFAFICDQILKYSTPYLSEGMEKSFANAVQYAQDVNTAFSQANTLGDLKNEVVQEAKEGLNYVHVVFVDVLDRLSVYPPVSWLVPATTEGKIDAPSKKTHLQNGYIDDEDKKNQ